MRGFGRKSFHGLMILCVTWFLVWTPVANAQTAIAAGRLSVAISEITIAKAARWGFAANDPRVTATRAGMSAGLTTLAVGAGLVSWPALLVAAGIAAVVGGAIALNKDGKYTWLFGADKSISAGGTSDGVYGLGVIPDSIKTAQYGKPIDANGFAYFGTFVTRDMYNNITGQYQVASSSPEGLGAVLIGQSFYGGGTLVSCTSNKCSANTNLRGYQEVFFQLSPSGGISSSTGFYDGRPPAPPVVAPVVLYTKVDEAVAAIPAAVAGQAVSPEILAASVNAAWKSATPASTSGGIPWSASDPVTPADVSIWMSANPGSVPSVSNFTQAGTASVSGQVTVPIGSTYSTGGGGSATLPSSGGSTSTGTGTGTTPSTGTTPAADAPTTGSDPNSVKLDLGPIPNIGAPTLEDTPTTAKILDPGFSLMPDLKAFNVPSHAGVCPTAKFALYGHDYTMDAHCSLMEQNRSVIGALMVLLFTLAATFTVLRA